MTDLSAPIELDITKAVSSSGAQPVTLRTFTSYSFDRSFMTPASAFRFTAPGVDKSVRLQVRSGDIAALYAINRAGVKKQVATGIIDETDTHITPGSVDYVLTGRDMLGQLVDNTAVDATNKIQNVKQVGIDTIAKLLIANTRIPKQVIIPQIPNGQFIFRTNPGETKISALQRYLDLCNSMVWSSPNGQMIIGKPNFTSQKSGSLIVNSSDPTKNNALEARVRRNLNTAIRTIVYQLQTLGQVDASSYTKQNNDQDMKAVKSALVGRSVYNVFSYGSGEDLVNQVNFVGNQTGSPRKIGDEYALREMAKDNMKVLDVEMVVEGHVNEQDEIYDINQMYNVQVEDEDLNEDMMVYNVSYELTKDHGKLTHLRLCRKGTMVAFADQIARTT